MSLTMPYSEQAERAVLGTVLSEPDKYASYIVQVLNEEDFYLTFTKKIYRAIQAIIESRNKVDFTSIANKLNDMGELEAIGGVEELTTLVDGVVNANVDYYVDELKAKTNLRRLSAYLEKACDEFDSNVSKDIGDFFHTFEDDVLNITRNIEVGDFKNINEVTGAYKELLNSNKKHDDYIPTGYAGINKILNGGFHRGDLIILGARTGMGKTNLALNFAYNVAKNKTPVAFFSVEMGADQLLNRLIASAGTLDTSDVAAMNFPTNTDKLKLEEAFRKLKDIPLYFDDKPGLTLSELLMKARKIKSMHPELGLILVDYLQLLKCEAQSREQEVAKISRQLKELAREIDVPVIALTQLSRRADQVTGVKGSTDKVYKRPELADLRESGQIEQDADVIMFIFREKWGQDNKDENGKALNEEVEILVRKNRNGAPGETKLIFSSVNSRFYTPYANNDTKKDF